ncbi:MAG: FAD-dependent oxidoreductase [Deltaproteobacteria bacterium]|nr:FAD-dependent oxidoreductase [Deltaproteobacteria bacterium]
MVRADARGGNLRRVRADGEVTGAVLVVGGGIGGIQASLDLAEGGYKVYLAETRSAIGGHMAQLDKTFPTNDCAMCTISPKLVDAGRHLNIEILTNTDVEAVEGGPGDFSVTVRRRPRYIDPARCTGCADCERVCPIETPGRFEEGLTKQRAAYKLYPQAVPNAYAIEKKGVSPCRSACPAGQRAQGYIAHVRKGDYEAALRTIKLDNPFPGICGRICNHRCEDACNRGKLDEPLDIRALKRFVTDTLYAKPYVPPTAAERRHPEKIAVIGAGPCGLTAARDLCLQGYEVTVFEALPVAGGMLRVGVPAYRLPTEVIDREVREIVDLGVELRLGHPVTDVEELFGGGFEAVLIAVGAHEGLRLPIPGADLPGVLTNTSFLRDVRLEGAPDVGERVLVVGAGDVAMDCARTSVRLGKSVEVHYRRSREEASADPLEIAHAQEEGVAFHFFSNPVEILAGADGRVRGVRFQTMEPGEPDASGRRRPVPVPGSEHEVACDTVIFSVGQRAGLAFLPPGAGVQVTRENTVVADAETCATSRPGLFAAGDSITGTAFVIEAVASGHKAARGIHAHLRGEPLAPTLRERLPVAELDRVELLARAGRGELERSSRVGVPTLAVGERVRSFDEVSLGYGEAEAQAEAARCLACGVCSECFACVEACKAGAIDHEELERSEVLRVGAVVLAPGYEAYDAHLSQEFGLGRYPNVVTALQFERLLSASGPTHGHVRRPGDGKTPRKIAFLQCVGSRDRNHDYCSSVCCMYAAKEAIMAVEHEPGTEVAVYFMDARSFSKGYDEYYRRAREKYGIRYERCRVSRLLEEPETGDLVVRTVRERKIVEERFDLVVLSVGMEMSPGVRELGERLGIELDDHGFCRTTLFTPLETSRPGIFAAGPFREPKDIPETVVEASGAASRAATLLASARGTLTRAPEYPPERDVSGEEPRVGVFVCHCGSNIGGFLDVPAVAEYAKSLPGVLHAEANLYTCSQDTVRHITETAVELGLNRVVVASCSPRTHEPLFQDACRAAGLNPALFEMANIRNQCSWVHSHEWGAATRKAMDLVRGAAARAGRLSPVTRFAFPVRKAALVLGGGAAGMTAALELGDQGFHVYLVEREAELGGNLRRVRYLESGLRPAEFLGDLVRRTRRHPKVEVYLETRLLELSGFQGNFRSTLAAGTSAPVEVEHGVAIVATGAQEYRGPEYGLGTHPSVLTALDFEELVYRKAGGNGKEDRLYRVPARPVPDKIAMLLCVGPAERYCSRTCCTTAIKDALLLKELRPAAEITILYKDIRTYGFKERLYTEARRRGILFRRYDPSERPRVSIDWNSLRLDYRDAGTGKDVLLRPEMLVLAEPLVPQADARDLATRLKAPLDADGFFMEAHVKLRPVDFQTNGLFLAGLAHYPKLLSESIAQAQAAAARAATLLSKEELHSDGIVARVDPEKCAGCLTCVRACPYDVPRIRPELTGAGGLPGAAYVEPAVCHGCGVCAGECPAKAIELAHFTDPQVLSLVDSLFTERTPYDGTRRPDAASGGC